MAKQRKGGVRRFGDLWDLDFDDEPEPPRMGQPSSAKRSSKRGDGQRVSRNREDRFDRNSGRFHGSDGEFEPGSPPPDLDQDTNRYRGKNGRFKKRSQDLFDEPEEVRLDSLDPRG